MSDPYVIAGEHPDSRLERLDAEGKAPPVSELQNITWRYDELRRATREYVEHFCRDCEDDGICNIKTGMFDLLSELTMGER